MARIRRTVKPRTFGHPRSATLRSAEITLMHLRRIESLSRVPFEDSRTSSTGGWRKSGEDDLRRLSQSSATRMHMHVAWRTIEEPGSSGIGLPRETLLARASYYRLECRLSDREVLKMNVSDEDRPRHSSGVPLGCPVAVALSEPGRALTALASASVSASLSRAGRRCRMCGWDGEGRRQESVHIKSPPRTAYVSCAIQTPLR